MCTVSWWPNQGGYELFFNRDELHSRAPESPPRRDSLNGCAFLSTVDGNFGGSWLLVNEFGVTVCLLNDYANPFQPAPAPGPTSRGHLVLACAAARIGAEAESILRTFPLATIKPFHLLVLTATEGPTLLHWAGGELIVKKTVEVAPPLSSSSFATEEVIRTRVQKFAETRKGALVVDRTFFETYHRQHDAAAGAHSVLMRRPDASTKSLCRVFVTAEWVGLEYHKVEWQPAGANLLPASAMTLARRASASVRGSQ